MTSRVLVALLLLVTLASCSSLSKSECEVGDWYAIGKSDGYDGSPAVSRIARHNEACNKYGISVDHERYNQGHQEGLLSYCTLDRGVSEGKAGRSYAGVCEGQGDFDFRRGHTIGMEYHDLTDKMNSLRSEINMARAEQKKHKPDTVDFYRLEGDIRVYHSEINHLSREQDLVQRRIDTLLSENYAYTPN